MASVIGSLCANRGKLRELAQHGGDDCLQLLGRGCNIHRDSSTVSQNNQIVGYLKELLEKMTDVNDTDSGIAQAADDVVQTFHLRGVQR